MLRAKLAKSSAEAEIEDIAAVVYATGFSASSSLDFLPQNIKDALGYDPSYPRLPLLINRYSLTSSETSPDNLALMGFFDGSYWGFLESQARAIARKWTVKETLLDNLQSRDGSAHLYSFMKEIRSKMTNDPSAVAQNFFGDYPGFMEETSRALGLQRIDLDWKPKEGMVSPARYIDAGCDEAESKKTMRKLQCMVNASETQRAFGARAVFRALQGTWKVQTKDVLDSTLEFLSATATFHSRYPTSSGYDLEYLFVLSEQPVQSTDVAVREREIERLVYRVRETDNEIEIWTVSRGLIADKVRNKLSFNTAISKEQDCLSVTANSVEDSDDQQTVIFSFYFAGVHVRRFVIETLVVNEVVGDKSSLEFIR